MKTLKDTINESFLNSKNWNYLNNIKNIKYTMVGFYSKKSTSLRHCVYADLFENIDDIKAVYKEDFNMDENESKPIIDEIEKLKVGEFYIHDAGKDGYEIISKIK